MKMKKADIIVPIVLIITSVLGIKETGNFTESAAILPKITFALIILLSLIILVKALITQSDKTVKFNWKRIIIMVALFGGYIIILPIVGYYVSTILFIGATMYMFGVRNKVTLIAVSIGFAVMVYIIFGLVLKLNPPKPFFMN